MWEINKHLNIYKLKFYLFICFKKISTDANTVRIYIFFKFIFTRETKKKKRKKNTLKYLAMQFYYVFKRYLLY